MRLDKSRVNDVLWTDAPVALPGDGSALTATGNNGVKAERLVTVSNAFSLEHQEGYDVQRILT